MPSIRSPMLTLRSASDPGCSSLNSSPASTVGNIAQPLPPSVQMTRSSISACGAAVCGSDSRGARCIGIDKPQNSAMAAPVATAKGDAFPEVNCMGGLPRGIAPAVDRPAGAVEPPVTVAVAIEPGLLLLSLVQKSAAVVVSEPTERRACCWGDLLPEEPRHRCCGVMLAPMAPLADEHNRCCGDCSWPSAKRSAEASASPVTALWHASTSEEASVANPGQWISVLATHRWALGCSFFSAR
mmetsp:Transcript_32098/g.88708  ORF Transcript_32098/g.88708 Transcript_32098/m.88708 type:complete len:241 (+) Transcript_32098:403-1125(+)